MQTERLCTPAVGAAGWLPPFGGAALAPAGTALTLADAALTLAGAALTLASAALAIADAVATLAGPMLALAGAALTLPPMGRGPGVLAVAGVCFCGVVMASGCVAWPVSALDGSLPRRKTAQRAAQAQPIARLGSPWRAREMRRRRPCRVDRVGLGLRARRIPVNAIRPAAPRRGYD